MAWGHDPYTPELSSEVATEVPAVAGDEVRGLGGEGCPKNRSVLLGDVYAVGKRGVTFWDYRESLDEVLQAFEPLDVVQVSASFLEGVGGPEELNVLELPKLEKTGIFPVGGREENVGVEEEPVHGAVSGLGALMRDGIGVEAHLPDLLTRSLVVLSVDGVVEKERRAALLRVNLNGKRNRRSEQEPLGGFLDQDFPSFLKSVVLAKRRRDHNGSSFTDSGDLRHDRQSLLF